MIKVVVFLFLTIFQDLNVENIQKKIEQIDRDLDSYTSRRDPDSGLFKSSNNDRYSKEGSLIPGLAVIVLDRYYFTGKIRKSVVTFDSGRIDQTSEYYYWENQVIYVYKRKTSYYSAKWSDDFDRTKASIWEISYYFNNGQLIKKSGMWTVNELSFDQILKDAALYRDYLIEE